MSTWYHEQDLSIKSLHTVHICLQWPSNDHLNFFLVRSTLSFRPFLYNNANNQNREKTAKCKILSQLLALFCNFVFCLVGRERGLSFQSEWHRGEEGMPAKLKTGDRKRCTWTLQTVVSMHLFYYGERTWYIFPGIKILYRQSILMSKRRACWF